MIQTKILNLRDYKKIEDLEKAIDTFANYEGFIFVGTSGKKNHLLIFQRVVQYPQPQQQMSYNSPEEGGEEPEQKKKGRPSKQNLPFPNAVYR
jgi:hypothetical protein